MEDQIVRKVRAELERGITSECQAVYLLVEIRKLLDRDRKGTVTYNSLRLYSDWAVHVELDRRQSQEIVKKADSFYRKQADGTLSEDENRDFVRVFALDTFRDELNQFLQAKRLRPFSDAKWNSFLACFLNVVEDCPLSCSVQGASVTEVDEVVIIREPGRVADGNPQAVIWALCFAGKFKMSFGGTDPLSGKAEDAIVAFIEARDRSAIDAPSGVETRGQK